MSTSPKRRIRQTTRTAKADRGGLGLHIAMVTPEIGPFAKTGGLADMVTALSLALERLEYKVSVVIPAYRSVLQSNLPFEQLETKLVVPISNRNEEGSVLKARLGRDISVYLIRADQYFDRDYFYVTPQGDYPDNAERFVFFARAALEILGTDPPQLIHSHDWQSALVNVFLRAQPERYSRICSAKAIFTVHNLGYQGLFWHLDWHLLNLDQGFFSPRHLEFYGKINFLKGGLVFADAITTVSPTYAEEIKTSEQGFGLEGIFRERASHLAGVLNGADYNVWNPQSDPSIAKNYDRKNLLGKKACKSSLQRAFGIPEKPDIPLVGMISRLTSQKGIDLLERAWGELFRRNLQLVLLGNGEKKYEERLSELVAMQPGRAGLRLGFDETLAHQIEAGADLFLMPSLYEPCGLNQMYSMKYGTIPIVRGTGGLKDSVKDYNPETRSGTGFVFGPDDAPALLQALDRALDLFQRKREWTALIREAMGADYSWERSARSYSDLYQKLLK